MRWHEIKKAPEAGAFKNASKNSKDCLGMWLTCFLNWKLCFCG
jgi:hypothetical protein